MLTYCILFYCRTTPSCLSPLTISRASSPTRLGFFEIPPRPLSSRRLSISPRSPYAWQIDQHENSIGSIVVSGAFAIIETVASVVSAS